MTRFMIGLPVFQVAAASVALEITAAVAVLLFVVLVSLVCLGCWWRLRQDGWMVKAAEVRAVNLERDRAIRRIVRIRNSALREMRGADGEDVIEAQAWEEPE